MVHTQLLLVLGLIVVRVISSNDIYLLGTGICDVTGPAAEVNLMGYAKFAQKAHGIHMRVFSRAFIFADQTYPSLRVVFVSVDSGMISTPVKRQVVSKLQSRYGNMYTDANICISATHTHSAVGGYFQYFLYQLPNLGLVKMSLDALVEGIVTSIDRAHNSMKPGRILYNQGQLLGANINRSPTAYLNNPDRNKYPHDTDKDMFLVKMVDVNNEPIAVLNWFPVHATSMNYTNSLVSGDNKGYASYLFEQVMNPTSLPGKGKFVAGFAQSHSGDVSPNTAGPMCQDTGLYCDAMTSTCNGNAGVCYALGPGKDMEDSTRIIGEMQMQKAMELFNSANETIVGPIRFIHQHVNMSDISFDLPNGEMAYTCNGALGKSFAAGTTDGSEALGFVQGPIQPGNTLIPVVWDEVRDLLKQPSIEQQRCHHPKDIFLITGEIDWPFDWSPAILPTQILAIGNLIIVSIPAELTTMSGRRLREAVLQSLRSSDDFFLNAHIVIAGLSNDYSSYVATFEEYQAQRYEGGSTLFGPHTLNAYIHQFTNLAYRMANGQAVKPGPDPPDLMPFQINALGSTLMDEPVNGVKIGGIVKDVYPLYETGDTVSVTFSCANPRNKLELERSFLTVERWTTYSKEGWTEIATDANWETKFRWEYANEVLHQSICTLEWKIPQLAATGIYRIRHNGYKKFLNGQIWPYEGISGTFKVTNSNEFGVVRFVNRIQPSFR